jgi:hypothetical protein
MVTRGFKSAIPLIFEEGSFSSFIDRYAGWPACRRLALDEFLQNPALFCLPQSVKQIARWFQRL